MRQFGRLWILTSDDPKSRRRLSNIFERMCEGESFKAHHAIDRQLTRGSMVAHDDAQILGGSMPIRGVLGIHPVIGRVHSRCQDLRCDAINSPMVSAF